MLVFVQTTRSVLVEPKSEKFAERGVVGRHRRPGFEIAEIGLGQLACGALAARAARHLLLEVGTEYAALPLVAASAESWHFRSLG